MDNESKKQFIDDIQKDITSMCFKSCFSLQKNRVNKGCFDICYDKYLNTLSTIHGHLKEYAYKHQSKYAYKVFPEEDLWFDIIYSHLFSKRGLKGPYDEYWIENDTFHRGRLR